MCELDPTTSLAMHAYWAKPELTLGWLDAVPPILASLKKLNKPGQEKLVPFAH